MTAAWSSPVQARPCSAANADADLVPPDLGVDEDPVEVEDDARRSARRPPSAAGSCGTGRLRPRGRRHGSGPVAAVGMAHRGRADRPSTAANTLSTNSATASASVVRCRGGPCPRPGSESRWPPWISTASSPSWTRFQRMSLPCGPRTLARDVDPDVDLRAGRRRLGTNMRVADGRVVAPDDPAVGVGLGAEQVERRLDRRRRPWAPSSPCAARASRQSLSRMRPSLPRLRDATRRVACGRG